MKGDNRKLIITLSIIIIILLGIVLYAFLIKPLFVKYTLQKQVIAYNQGVSNTIGVIANQINQKGYAQIQIGNQTVALAPVKLAKGTNAPSGANSSA